jgi:protein TonB
LVTLDDRLPTAPGRDIPLRGLLPAIAVHAAVAFGLIGAIAPVLRDPDPIVFEILLDLPGPTASAPPTPAAAPPEPEPEPEAEPEPQLVMPAPPPPRIEPKPRPPVRPRTVPAASPAITTPGETVADTPAPAVAAAPAATAPAATLPAAPVPTPAYAPILLDWLARHRDYPRAARLRRQEGAPHIALTLDRSGRLLELRLAQPSGHSALDDAALGMAQRAAPFPPPQLPQGSDRVTFIVPIRFNLERPAQ